MWHAATVYTRGCSCATAAQRGRVPARCPHGSPHTAQPLRTTHKNSGTVQTGACGERVCVQWRGQGYACSRTQRRSASTFLLDSRVRLASTINAVATEAAPTTARVDLT